ALVGIGRDVGCTRRLRLEGESIRIRLQCERLRGAPTDLELVALAFAQPRNEDLPDAIGGMKTHGMAPTIPAIKVAHHAHAPRARRPHQERDTGHAVENDTVRAKFLMGPAVRAPGPAVTGD